MSVITFARFVVITDDTGAVRTPIVEAILQRMWPCSRPAGKLPKNHLTNGTVLVNVFLSVDELRLHMVFYTIWCATIQEKNFAVADRCPVYVLCEEGNFREYLRGDVVWVKKYFYVLRPVLAIQWLEANLGPVPTEFGILVDRVVERDDSSERSVAITMILKINQLSSWRGILTAY